MSEINEETEVLAKPRELNDVVTYIASDRNTDVLTQGPNANEPILAWEEVRKAAAQPRK